MPKQAKDPNAPKRPLSAYFLFTKDARPKIKEAHSDWKVTEIAKEMGKQWHALDESSKVTYNKKAAKLKSEYEKAKEAYKKSL